MVNKKNLLQNNYGVELPDFEIQLGYRTMFNELIESMKRLDEEEEEYNQRREEEAEKRGLESRLDLPDEVELKKQLLPKLEKLILVTGAKPSFHLIENFIKELIERKDEWTIASVYDLLGDKVPKEAKVIVEDKFRLYVQNGWIDIAKDYKKSVLKVKQYNNLSLEFLKEDVKKGFISKAHERSGNLGEILKESNIIPNFTQKELIELSQPYLNAPKELEFEFGSSYMNTLIKYNMDIPEELIHILYKRMFSFKNRGELSNLPSVRRVMESTGVKPASNLLKRMYNWSLKDPDILSVHYLHKYFDFVPLEEDVKKAYAYYHKEKVDEAEIMIEELEWITGIKEVPGKGSSKNKIKS